MRQNDSEAIIPDEPFRPIEPEKPKLTERAKLQQSLIVQRENIVSQRTSNPQRRAALEAALAAIERQIETLDSGTRPSTSEDAE